MTDSGSDGGGALPGGRRRAIQHSNGSSPPASWETRSGGRSGSSTGQAPDITVYVQILRDQWWVVLIVFLVVSVGVAAGTLTKSNMYRATATFEIRPPTVHGGPAEALAEPERLSEQYLQTQFALLRGKAPVRRALADPALATRLGAVKRDATQQLNGADAALLERVRKRVTVDPIAGSRLVRVSFEAAEPELAADVANAVVAAYMAMRGETGLAALDRVNTQLDSVRSAVLTAEKQLQQFVRENGLVGVLAAGGQQGETVPQERLRRLQQELTAADAEAYRFQALSNPPIGGVSAVPDSELLNRLRSRIAELEGEYARLRSTFTDSFPRARQVRTELAQLDSMLVREEQRILTTLTGQQQATLRRRNLLETAVAQQRVLLDNLASRLGEYDRLRRDLEGQEQTYTALQQKRKEATLAAALASVEVLDPATPPAGPISPQPRRDIPLGALAGLALGLGLAFVRHMSNGSVRTVQDVQGFDGAPVLATIPAAALPHQSLRGRLTPGHRAGWHRIDRPGASFAMLDEAFSGLRTSMLYDLSGHDRRTLLVTSTQPNEGKTTVSTNLSISMARLGRRVLLVDADTRRPSVHRLFSLPAGPGLSEYLVSAVDWREVVRRDVAPGLDAITAGGGLANPADALSSSRVADLLLEGRREYDFVVLDAPALFINVPDARILAHQVDGVILVVRSGVADRGIVQQMLAGVENLVGVVLNDLSHRYIPDYYRDYDQRERTPSSERPRPPQLGSGPHTYADGHEFRDAICTRCGCSEDAVRGFGWRCTPGVVPAGSSSEPMTRSITDGPGVHK